MSKPNDCVCGFPSGRNGDNCERCKLIARIGVLENVIAQMQATAEDFDDYCNTETRLMLTEILDYCRLTGQRPTVESIERALKGHSFAHVLSEIP